MYDIVIVGAGPAGLSAAITARARGKQVLVISNKPEESPLAKSTLVDNYPGVAAISGAQLLLQMLDHALAVGVEFDFTRVITILPMGAHFSITTSSDFVESQAVILTPGAATGGKSYEGEADYLGRGVSYCATCDGMLYRNASVSIVGLTPDAVEEANFMVSIGATVHYVSREIPEGLAEGIIVHAGKVAAIEGDALGVTALVIKAANAEKTERIECSGVFILRPSIAPDALIGGLELRDGYIAVDNGMRTNIPGVFAAGDCTGKPLQIAKATGDGQVACLSAVEYLDKG
jgi:thioredoxin reductase (NADPH)